MIAVNGVLGVLLTSQSKNTLQAHMRERMLDISKSAAALLNGDEIEKLQKEDKDTEPYQRALATLRAFQEQVELKYIYGIRDMGGKKFTFTIDPTVEDPGEFGEPIEYTDALYEASLGNPSVDKTPYQDRWGRFYSAYSPVLNSDGKVAGIVAVDIDANWYESQLRRNVYTTIIVCAISILGGGAIVFLIIGKIRKRFVSINSEMGRLANDVEELAAELRLASGTDRYNADAEYSTSNARDDFEILESKLKFMRTELKQYISDARAKAFADALTGLGNRNAYLDAMKRYDAKIAQGDAKFALAVFDINGLKEGNDRFGHEYGDLMITTIANILKETVKGGELFRIGGDEFVAIADNAEMPAFEKAFAAIDKKLEKMGNVLTLGEKQMALAVSKGAASYIKGSDMEIKTVFHRADDAMYADKTAWYANHGDRRRHRR